MNLGSFEHEEEILLGDGLNYGVIFIQDEKYKVYKFNQDHKLLSRDFTFKEGTRVLLVNDQPDEEYGEIAIRPLEGELSDTYKTWLVPPHKIEFVEEVASLDSKGKPITVITL